MMNESNIKYGAWVAGMARASDRNFRQLERFAGSLDVALKINTIGCLHWFYYSIMFLFGYGSDYQFYCTGVGLIYSFDRKKAGFFWKLNGIYCLLSATEFVIAFLFKVLRLTSASGSSVPFSFLSGSLLTIMAVLNYVGLIIISLVSLCFGRRYIAYLVNRLLLLMMLMAAFMGFLGNVVMIAVICVLIGSLKINVKEPISITYCYSHTGRTASVHKSASEYNTVPVSVPQTDDYRSEMEERWRREDEQYEAWKREDRIRKINKSIDDLKNQIRYMENEKKGLDNMMDHYNKNPNSVAYSVDPRANRFKYNKYCERIDECKREIEQLEQELRTI